jgi:hypothetical protein
MFIHSPSKPAKLEMSGDSRDYQRDHAWEMAPEDLRKFHATMKKGHKIMTTTHGGTPCAKHNQSVY